MTKTFNRLAMAAMLASVAAFSISAVDARPGGGKSSGSRGSQTNAAPPSTNTAPGGAQPMNRSINQGAPSQPAAAPARPGAPAAAPAAPSMARNMMMGVAAGLLGAGLFGLLSGSGFFSGLASLAGLFGFLLQLALIGGVVFLVMRFLRARREAAAGGAPSTMNPMAGRPMDAMQRQAAPAAAGMAGGAGFAAQQAYSQPQPLQLSGDDFNSFEKLLHDIQMGYGREDIGAIRALSTPEMAAYMEGDMRETEEKGLVNRIANVKLLQGDLAEAWREPSGEYATVAMRYAISDALVDRKTGRAVEGDLNAIGEVTEIWTFVRQPGDAWKLSAIQQTAPAMA